MREIKFRVFYPEYGQSLQPTMLYSSDYETHGELLTIAESDLRVLGPGTLKIMQSTGLHDKNGKEIFEGDVIRLIEPNRLYTVEWAEFGFKLFHADPNLNKLQWGSLNRVAEFKWSIEVIGNIYKHKHLLK